MTRKVLTSLAVAGLLSPVLAQAAPVAKKPVPAPAKKMIAPPTKLRTISLLERGQPQLRPGVPTAKLGATRCDPKETADAELKDITAVAKLYTGYVNALATKSKSPNASFIPKHFQAVVTKRTDGAIRALEATYRFIAQQLVAAIKFSTQAHKAAKAKHEPNDPKAGEYARTLYAKARRMLDGLENLRRFEVNQLGDVFWKKVFVTAKLGENLIENLNKKLASQPSTLKLLKDVPSDRMGPTGTPLAAAGLALTHARHGFERYRDAIAEVLRAGKEKEPYAMINRNGGTVVQTCFFNARDAFSSLVDRIKTDMEPEEEAAAEEEDTPAEEE